MLEGPEKSLIIPEEFQKISVFIHQEIFPIIGHVSPKQLPHFHQESEDFREHLSQAIKQKVAQSPRNKYDT